MRKALLVDLESTPLETKPKLSGPNMNVIMNLGDPHSANQEVFFRYCHEANKVLFLLRCVRRIFDFLHANKIYKSIMIFGCFLLIKAKFRVQYLLSSLVRRENKYKQLRFKQFLRSEQYEQIVIQFQKLKKHCSVMENRLKGSHRFRFFIIEYKLNKILNGRITDREYHQIMTSQLVGLIKEKILGSCSGEKKLIK